MSEFPLQRMALIGASFQEDPPRSGSTGFTTIDPRHPDYVAPTDEIIPLMTDEIPVLWQGAL